MNSIPNGIYFAQCVNCDRSNIYEKRDREKTKITTTTKNTRTHNWKLFQCVVREINGIDQYTIEQQQQKNINIRNLNSIHNLYRFFFVRA